MALHANTSALTAIANDYDYSDVFVRQIEAFGRPGDVLVGLSTSGKSANVLKALDYAKKKGLKTIGFTGRKADTMSSLCDVLLSVPSEDTPRIQKFTCFGGISSAVWWRMDFSMKENRGRLAVILAGGLGTRLRGVVSDVPKALAPIAGRPFLDWLLTMLSCRGITKILLLLGYGADKIMAFVEDGSKWNLKATYSLEKEPLDKGGALRNALPYIDERTFFFMNGDTLLDMDLGITRFIIKSALFRARL